MHRVKANTNVKVDLYVNGEILEPGEDKRLISQIPLRDKMVFTILQLLVHYRMRIHIWSRAVCLYTLVIK